MAKPIWRRGRKVLFAHPGGNDLDATIVFGVNHQTLLAEHRIVSNASCTTNCIIPVIKLLDDAYSIESGTVTTIHSAMNDQPVIDAYHADLRRTRAASQSIIPVDTAGRGHHPYLPAVLRSLRGDLGARADHQRDGYRS